MTHTSKKHKHKHYIDPMEEIKDDLDYIILKKGVEEENKRLEKQEDSIGHENKPIKDIKDTHDPDAWFYVGFLVVLGVIAILFATLFIKHF